MKRLNKSLPISYKYNFTQSQNFYKDYFFENYKTDILEYYSFENVNYKIFINYNFIKTKRTNSNKKQDLMKDINTTNINKFVNMMLKSGGKLKFFNYLNTVTNIFYYSFIYKSSFLQNKFDNYTLFFNFSRENSFFFNFNFILNNILVLNESIFNIKVVKLDKRNKKRLKKKYDFEVKYLKKQKRKGFVFKALHLYSNSFNYYKYHERLLASLLTTFFFQKNSKIYKKKLFAYSSVLKKKSL